MDAIILLINIYPLNYLHLKRKEYVCGTKITVCIKVIVWLIGDINLYICTVKYIYVQM